MKRNGKYEVCFEVENRDKKYKLTIECDRWNKVLGQIVTEEYVNNKKDIIKSFIIPIDKVYHIKDGDIVCL